MYLDYDWCHIKPILYQKELLFHSSSIRERSGGAAGVDSTVMPIPDSGHIKSI